MFTNPLSIYYKKNRMPLSSAEIFEDPLIYSVDPDQTASIRYLASVFRVNSYDLCLR